MKRVWLYICISILALLAAGGAFLWFSLFRGTTPITGTEPQGKLSTIKYELTRGYHTAALVKLLSDDQPESVLIAIQNDWELRASGGFITAFGDGQIVNGALQNFRVVPSDYFDAEITLQPPMPSGLGYRISTPSLTMRDSNWDVDFPTTAGTLSRYYEDATGVKPNVVVAVTTKAAEHILQHTGPLTFTVNGHDLTVTADDVTDTLERYTDQEFRELGLEWETRKQILSAFGDALLPRLHELARQSPTDLLKLTNELVSQYDVQLWSSKPALAGHIKALGTYQKVEPTSVSENGSASDALLIVDTNVGARKTNSVIDQRVDYRVDLSKPVPSAKLHITYTHNGPYQPTIIEYHDTVRVYAPAGSKLQSSEGLTNITSYARHGRTVFEGRLVLEPGKSTTISLSYTLGSAITATTIDQYRLLLERQPGALGYPVQVTVFDGIETATIATDVARDRSLTLESN